MKKGFASLCLFVAGLMLISAGAVVSVQPTFAAPLADITETVTEPPTFTPNPTATSTETATPAETAIPTQTATPPRAATATDTPPVETAISNVTLTPRSAVSTPTPALDVTGTPSPDVTGTPALDVTGTPDLTTTATPVIVLDTTGGQGRAGGLNPAGLALIGLGCLFIVMAVALSARKSAGRA